MATRERKRRAREHLVGLQPHLGEGCAHAARDLVRAKARDPERKAHLAPDARLEELALRELEGKAEPALELPACPGVAREVAPTELGHARGGAREASRKLEGRRLARAGPPHECDDLAGPRGQVCPLEGHALAGKPPVVDETGVLELKRGAGGAGLGRYGRGGWLGYGSTHAGGTPARQARPQ